MNYEIFKKVLLQELEDRLGQGAIREEEALNRYDQRTDAFVHQYPEGSTMIYPENFYQRYQGGEPLEHILDSLGEILEYMQSLGEEETITDKEAILKQIIPAFLPRDTGEQYQKEMVCRPFLDLKTVCKLELEEGYTVTITKQHLKKLGLNEEELFEAALKNVKEETVYLKDVVKLLDDLQFYETERLPLPPMSPKEEGEIPGLWVLRADRSEYGAHVLLSQETLKAVSDYFQGDYYILPSSIHEVMVYPKREGGLSAEEFQGIVQDINNTVVRPSDRLSDSVYLYHAKEQTLSIEAGIYKEPEKTPHF